MLNLKWTPDAKPTTLVPGSKWRSRKTQLECLLIVAGESWSICYNGRAIISPHGCVTHGHDDMLDWLARDFEPVDPPKDTRTLEEMQSGECFVPNGGAVSVWMKNYNIGDHDTRCIDLGSGSHASFNSSSVPFRILGRINPDSIAAILREAGGGA